MLPLMGADIWQPLEQQFQSSHPFPSDLAWLRTKEQRLFAGRVRTEP